MSVQRYCAEASGMIFCAECAQVEAEEYGDACTPLPATAEETEFGEFYFHCEGCDETHPIASDSWPESDSYA